MLVGLSARSIGRDAFGRTGHIAKGMAGGYSKLGQRQKTLLKMAGGIGGTASPIIYSNYKKRKGDWKSGERHWTDNLY